MSDLDDLRRTLDARADDVEPGGAGARRTAIQHRIGVARRRRRVAGAGTVAAVVAVVGGVSVLSGGQDESGPEPARTVVGVRVPGQLLATGYTYEAGQVVEDSDGTASVTLPAAPVGRLVSWATAGEDQDVTVTGGSANQPLHFDVADFGSWVLVPQSDGPQTVEVAAASGGVGLVVYELGDEPPVGFSEAGVTARGTVAGGELIGAAVGEPGQAEVTVPVTATGGTVWVHYACTGAPRGSRLDVERDGERFVLGARCDETLPVDMSGLSDSGYDSRPGDRATLTATVSEGRNGPLVESDDVQVALTVYSETAVGDDPAYLVEAAGHTWRLAEQHEASGADPLAVPAPTGGGPVWAVADAVRGAADIDFGQAGQIQVSGGGGVSELVDAGQEVRMDPAGGASTRRIVFYERAD